MLSPYRASLYLNSMRARSNTLIVSAQIHGGPIRYISLCSSPLYTISRFLSLKQRVASSCPGFLPTGVPFPLTLSSKTESSRLFPTPSLRA
ncbi:uncharacterized protein BDR25DRAFT_43377 [Lindgomyces ingoldianus]|uniref:Uncharacterized protein n=1 Tax=Lindgomyces ingoldianus TaxID=673940 RepID=A0ACB6RD17_9PLEO|nr:uncharacterized protein BDR25DRAFT_43377 [Lindgomyces ingoldianus]KAF2477041.1 hypothetical protein BDR25DRAFT_43377 [Lindgomyces ingoldianus]